MHGLKKRCPRISNNKRQICYLEARKIYRLCSMKKKSIKETPNLVTGRVLNKWALIAKSAVDYNKSNDVN